MKTKLFEPGAICAAVALLLVLSLPAYAKNGGSSTSHTRVGKTSSNATSVKPVTSSRKTQSGTLQKSETVAVQPKSSSKMGAANKTKKEVDALKPQLGKVETDTKTLLRNIEDKKGQETDAADRIKGQQDKSGSIQNNVDANRQQIEVNKSEAGDQKADDQRKSVSDRNQAIKDNIKKTIDQSNEIGRATGCGGLGC